jgi:hypothetical protein
MAPKAILILGFINELPCCWPFHPLPPIATLLLFLNRAIQQSRSSVERARGGGCQIQMGELYLFELESKSQINFGTMAMPIY